MLYLKNFLASVHYLNHPTISGPGALTLLLMGIFVLTRNFKSKLYRTFFWFMFVIAIWFIGNTLSMLYSNNLDLSIFWFRIGYTGVVFMAAAFYHFYLTQVKKKNTLFLYSLYLIGILEVVFLWFFNAKTGAYALPNVGVIWKGMSLFSYFLTFGMAKYTIVALLTAIALFNEYKKASGLEKKRLQWITIYFFALVLGSIEWLVSFGIPLHIGWLAIPLVLIPLSYAIIKYQLMDVKAILTELLVWLMAIILLILPFLMPNLSLKIFTLVIFLLFCFVGYLLIKSIYSEISKKESLEKVTQELKELNLTLDKKVKERTAELEEERASLEIKVKARTQELQELAESLEEKVKERIKELQKRIEELEKFHRLTVGRELKMMELKKEIKRLKKKLELKS